MAAGRELALLGLGRIADELHEVRLDAREIQQRVALGRRAIGRDGLALGPRVQQEIEKAVLHRLCAFLERDVKGIVIHAPAAFLGQYRAHGDALGIGGLDPTGIDAQRPAMGRQLFDVEHPQARVAHDPANGQQRQVREMFVVDRVELAELDQPHQVRKFQRDHALGFQRNRHSSGKVIYIRYMRINVIAKDEVGRRQPARQFLAEELLHHGYAKGFCRLGGAARGLDPQAGNARSDEVLQQITVIRRNLDHVAVMGQVQPPGDHLDIGRGMIQPALRGRREIGVVVGKQLVHRGKILGLHKAAFRAGAQAQRIVDLGLRQLFLGQVGIRRRRMAKVEKVQRQRALAMAASGCDSHSGDISFSTGSSRSRSERWTGGSGQSMPSSGSSGFTPPS